MRIDKPILKCDRCERETMDLTEMGQFYRLEHSHMSGQEGWDLCPACAEAFTAFMHRLVI